MAFRLADLVVCGEIFNNHPYSVHGRILLRAPGEDRTIVLELTGSPSEDLAGWHFRFEPRTPPVEYDPAVHPDMSEESNIAWHQIGPTGTFTAARLVRALGRPPEEKHPALYLEWFSQNGRVLIELMDPIIEFIDRKEWAGIPSPAYEPTPGAQDEPDEPEDAGTPGLGITAIEIDDDGEAHVHEIDPADFGGDAAEDDPYNLMPPELQRELDAEAWRVDEGLTAEEDKSKCLRELELMDHCIENEPGVPLGEIFDGVLRVPRPDRLTEGPQAEEVLKTVLAQMALYGIQYAICEHFTPLQAYRLLVEEICPDTRVFPQMRGTQWVQCHMTSEYCPKCEEEMDRKYRDYERDRAEHPEKYEPNPGPTNDEDIPF